MSTYFSHGDDFRYEPLPVPTHIKETIEEVVFKARASHAATYLLIDVLGKDTWELHPNDEAEIKRTHE